MAHVASTTQRARRFLGVLYSAAILFTCLAMTGTGCPFGAAPPIVPPPTEEPAFNNTTDRGNANATFIGRDACATCHPGIADTHRIHGHSYKLSKIEGAAPTFPVEGLNAGVPNPPTGFTWPDIAYVIGGYTKKARFINQDGFILTTGLLSIPTQWNLKNPANGTVPGFVNYEPTLTHDKPYDYSCFLCHTTGPVKQDEDNPKYQDNRPGLIGTWAEPGIQCEACHGPGSNHVPNPQAREIFVDKSGALTCKECHNRPFNSDTNEIIASGGFLQHHEQWPELKASGGHKDFACTVCHDPHVSVNYSRDTAIRATCTSCHPDANMALHKGKIFTRGDYTEVLSCESCHMPYATKSGSSAVAGVVGAKGRMGDTRTHIFRISTEPLDYTGFLTADGKQAVRDDQGRAAVTVDFVCLRCHNENTIPSLAFTVERAAELAIGLHLPTALNEKSKP
ncbi:MAG: hypothetical protein HZA51_12570 [Planctomycetes bacterium]|nr:hypothetical protein [Planctomycetota bacterium]